MLNSQDPHASDVTQPPALEVPRFGHLQGVLDVFAPPHRQADEDEVLRGRILVAINLVYIVALVGILGVREWAVDMPGMDRTLTRLILGGLATGLIGNLLLFRFTGSIAVASTGTVVAIYCALVGAVAMQGGFSDSPSLAVFLVLPVIAGLFSGRFGGLVWSGVVITTWSFFYGLHNAGYVSPGVLPPGTREANVLLNLTCACVGISLVVSIHQSLNQRLRGALEHERLMLAHQAGHDPLTDLANRRKFNELLKTGIQRATRVDRQLAIVILDLNDFKPVNDRYGHGAGDEVLRQISRRLRAHTRATDTVARIGGDEFAILMEFVESAEGISVYLQSLTGSLARPHPIEGEEVFVSASIGVSLYPSDGRDAEALLCRADDAMYQSKATRAPYCFASDVKESPTRDCVPQSEADA